MCLLNHALEAKTCSTFCQEEENKKWRDKPTMKAEEVTCNLHQLLDAFRFCIAQPPWVTSSLVEGVLDPIPFRYTARIAPLTQDCPISQDRLTHVQLLFTWNLSPLQSSKFSFEYLLLPPRSAPEAVSLGLTPKAAPRPLRPPFPRGTCSLSVSCLYLALEGIYLPLRAAFPNSPTRRQRLVEQQGPNSTGFSPSPTSRSRELGPGPLQRTLLQTTIRGAKPLDFQAGLFPVRSPLLGKSWLVSSPPLSDMLKLSG